MWVFIFPALGELQQNSCHGRHLDIITEEVQVDNAFHSHILSPGLWCYTCWLTDMGHVINYTRAFPTIKSQNVCREKGLLATIEEGLIREIC